MPKSRATLDSKKIVDENKNHLIQSITYNSFSEDVSSDLSTSCARSRKTGPHHDKEPKAKATHVNPSVVKAKLLLNLKKK